MVLSDVLPGADEAGECLGDPEDVDVELDELLQSLTFSVYLEIGHLIQCHFPRHCLCVCNASHCECPIVALQKKNNGIPLESQHYIWIALRHWHGLNGVVPLDLDHFSGNPHRETKLTHTTAHHIHAWSRRHTPRRPDA